MHYSLDLPGSPFFELNDSKDSEIRFTARILGADYWMYQKRQTKKICCTSENPKYGNDHCGTHSGDKL